MTIDLTSIANAVIALIAAIITAFVIPWIRSKTTAAQFEKIKMWVTVAVEAAEQLYTGSGRGAEKKAYVVEFLNSKGFKIDAETLDKLARRKILCKRFSTKSRMALENRADSGLDPLITESHGGQNGMCAGTA